MIPPLPPPPLPEPHPEAVITRQGRWIYHVVIVDGLTSTNSPWIAFGRRHAQRVARKKLAWYVRRFVTPPERWTIRPGAMSERCVRSAFAAMCAYEAAAIASRRAPTVSMLCRRHRWCEAALLGFLLVHLHHAAKAVTP